MTESTRRRLERAARSLRGEWNYCIVLSSAWHLSERQRRQLMESAKCYRMRAERYQDWLDRA